MRDHGIMGRYVDRCRASPRFHEPQTLKAARDRPLGIARFITVTEDEETLFARVIAERIRESGY